MVVWTGKGGYIYSIYCRGCVTSSLLKLNEVVTHKPYMLICWLLLYGISTARNIFVFENIVYTTIVYYDNE